MLIDEVTNLNTELVLFESDGNGICNYFWIRPIMPRTFPGLYGFDVINIPKFF